MKGRFRRHIKQEMINFKAGDYLELVHSQEFELRRDILYSSWGGSDLYGKNKGHGEYNTGRFKKCRHIVLKTAIDEGSAYL